MNSNYILPVTVAAALHGVLLFGIPKTARPLPRLIEESTVIVCHLPPLPEPDPVELVATSGEESRAKEPVAPPPPMQPEPVIGPIESTLTFTPPKIPAAAPGEITNVIPRGYRPGDGTGLDIGTGPILPIHLDNSPRTRFQTQPVYPFEAKRSGMSGTVTVEFIVDESGRVLDPRVVASTDRIFEENTLRAVAKWQFEPGRRAGRIVRFRMAVPVVFNLSE